MRCMNCDFTIINLCNSFFFFFFFEFLPLKMLTFVFYLLSSILFFQQGGFEKSKGEQTLHFWNIHMVTSYRIIIHCLIDFFLVGNRE